MYLVDRKELCQLESVELPVPWGQHALGLRGVPGQVTGLSYTSSSISQQGTHVFCDFDTSNPRGIIVGRGVPFLTLNRPGHWVGRGRRWEFQSSGLFRETQQLISGSILAYSNGFKQRFVGFFYTKQLCPGGSWGSSWCLG